MLTITLYGLSMPPMASKETNRVEISMCLPIVSVLALLNHLVVVLAQPLLRQSQPDRILVSFARSTGPSSFEWGSPVRPEISWARPLTLVIRLGRHKQLWIEMAGESQILNGLSKTRDPIG